MDHIKNTLSIAFSAVRWLVLDEADRSVCEGELIYDLGHFVFLKLQFLEAPVVWF